MFETISQKVGSGIKPEPIETITAFSNLLVNGHDIVGYLSGTHTNEELQKYFRQFYSVILTEIYENNNLELKNSLWNPDNIINYSLVIQSITEFKLQEKEFINYMIYEFFSSKNLDSEFKEKLKVNFLNMSKSVNRETVNKLSMFVPVDLAALLSMARFSTNDTNRATKRVNTILIQQDPEFLTEQKIVDIYLSLYDRVTPLFVGIMSDYRNPKQMGTTANINWSIIDLAILDILENMPTEEISKVMKSFIDTIKLGYLKQTKFSMDSVNTIDYPRTVKVYENCLLNNAV